MRFSEHWKSHLDFDFYVSRLNNESIIERRWLKDTVDTHLLEVNGILLTADMGYGKSSIISNIVCANSSSVWYDFRKKVLAYHFCRHNMAMTLNAGTFIRNLASAIVKFYPEMGNAILADDIAVDFLDGIRCYKDPISCFEMSILNPLQGRWINQEFIVLIDALDVCESASGNNLFHFLLTQIQRFPPNFKFVLTSRNIDNVHKKFQFLDEIIKHIYLNTLNSYNLKDVQNYVRQTSQLTEPQITTLTKAANGNFLHVNLYLQYCKKTDTFDLRNVPNSLAQFYQFNFNKIFEASGNLFNDFLPVFEVLCTIQNPIDKDQLIEVSQIKDKSKRRQLETLLGNELGHFLVFEDGKMSFLHKSISDFLTDGRRNTLQFFVHKENGHKLFVENLLEKFRMNSASTHYLTELIHHVAMSNFFEFETRLFNVVRDLLRRDQLLHLELLYQLVGKYNDYHTTELLLKYINVDAINTINSMNQSPAFTAASQGNEKTLKCLLNNGANSSFSVVHSHSSTKDSIYNKDENILVYTSRSITHDIVKLCKYVYFCGYNVFHISAQNGHTYVVEMILQKYRHLIYSETDMRLNAFHLAVEHGQLNIVKLLLNYNKSFADTHSLYKASEKGHTQILKLLLGAGLKDECLPCNGIFYWLPLLSNRHQQSKKYDKIIDRLSFNQDVYIKTLFYDDWRLITCETALNAAVRNGHLDIVKILLRERSSANNCTTYDGKTPLMTAVRYNRTDIFYHLYLNGANLKTKCVHSFIIHTVKAQLDISEINLLTKEQCPVGATIAHIIAMYGNSNIILFMYKHGFADWELRDADKATPLHYAFCYHNSKFFEFTHLLKRNLNFSAVTINGSSVFHSSAICRSFSLFYYHNRNDKYHLNIPDSLDHRRRSILHYSMLLPMKQNDGNINDGDVEHRMIWTIFHVCLNSKHDFLRTDNEGRNFLHYAAKSGNYFGFDNAFQMLCDYDVKRLLTQRDETKKTPVDEIFHSMHMRQSLDPVRIPEGCSISDVFKTKRPKNCKTILTNHELCILRALVYLNHMDMFANFNVSDWLTIAIRKSRMYPVLMLSNNAEQQFQHAVHNNPPLHQFITEYNGPNIADLFLTKYNSLKCDGSLSPLHEIVMNDRNTLALYHNKEFLNRYLKDYSSKMLDSCFDKDGYNLLHRAVMGGNLLGTQFLLNKGMNVSYLSRQDQSTLYILLTKAPFLDKDKVPLRYGNSFPFHVLHMISENKTQQTRFDDRDAKKYDETAEFVIDNLYTSKGIRKIEIKTLLCESNVSHLSLVHLGAAKGFLDFLKKCTLLFGSDILNCYDLNRITPYYLARIYKQESIMKWMISLRVSLTKPNLGIESLLIYNMLFNHKRRRIFDWTCRLQYSYHHYGLIQAQNAKCRQDVRDNYTLYRNLFRDRHIQGFFIVVNSMYPFQINPVIGYCNAHDTMHLCSVLVDTNNLVIRQLKSFQRQAYVRLRKWMTFGEHDNMFLYQSALRHIFKEHERKYLKALSFNSIFSPQFRYLEQLRQKYSIHIQWLAHFMEHLEENNEISSRVYLKYEQKITSQFDLNILLPGFVSQYDRKTDLSKLKLDAYEKNKNNFYQCEDVQISIEKYLEICSVKYVLWLKDSCEIEFRNKGKMQMSTEQIKRERHNYIAYLEQEARVNPQFKERLKLFKKNMSILLYFMQFVQNDIKSSLCMKRLIAQANYAMKMNL